MSRFGSDVALLALRRRFWGRSGASAVEASARATTNADGTFLKFSGRPVAVPAGPKTGNIENKAR